MYNGKIVGIWSKVLKKETVSIEISAFEQKLMPKREILDEMKNKYLLFYLFTAK
jgi:hypothetical protein